MTTNFRNIVQNAAYRFARGHIAYGSAKTCKTRGGKFFSEISEVHIKDAILRRSGGKSWDITGPNGQTFRKQEDSKLFRFLKVRPITERSYKILIRKRTSHPETTL